MTNKFAEKLKGLMLLEEIKKLGTINPHRFMFPTDHVKDSHGKDCYYFATFKPAALAQAVRVYLRQTLGYACVGIGKQGEHVYIRRQSRAYRRRHRKGGLRL